jgi:hypothetical protein
MREKLGRWLAVASFVVYAAAALTLHQEKHFHFRVEQGSPFEEVLSHRLAQTPFGAIDTGVQRYLRGQSPSVPAEQTIERAIGGMAVPSGETTLSSDGIGCGSFIMAELATAVFGLSARALPLFFVLLIGISAACFIIRFRDGRLAAVPVVLLSLTLLLASPLAGGFDANEAPLGGFRYYAVLGILPALHWCFDILDKEASGIWRCRAPLAVQTALLALSILVRYSPIYLLLPSVAVTIFVWRKHRARSQRRRAAVCLLIPMAAILSVAYGAPHLMFRSYEEQGRLNGTLWHRLLVGIAFRNPEWPFPGVHERFSCPDVPRGMDATGDRVGHCIWEDYARKHGLGGDAREGVYSAAYEAVMHRAVLDMVTAYPGQVFRTFLFYKPLNAYRQIRQFMGPSGWRAPPLVWSLVAAQFALLIGFVAARGERWRTESRPLFAMLGLFLLMSLIPQWLAWTLPSTAIDLLAYILMGGALVPVSTAASLLRRLGIGRDAEVERRATG